MTVTLALHHALLCLHEYDKRRLREVDGLKKTVPRDLLRCLSNAREIDACSRTKQERFKNVASCRGRPLLRRKEHD